MISTNPRPTSSRAMRRAALVALVFGMSASYAAQPVPVGVKVYVQAWSPLSPANDMPTTAFASRDGISSGMNAAWDEGRKLLADGSQRGSLRWRLEQPNLVAAGITLRFLSFNLNPLGPIDLQPAGMGGLRIHWQIPDSYFDFKSTTPGVAGVGASRDADPEFSFRFDLDITLGAAVADAPGGALLSVTDIRVVPSHLSFDSHNLGGDAVKAAADAVSTFMKGEGLNSLLNQVLGGKNLAASQNNGGYDLVKIVNAKLMPLNAQIAGSGALKYARVGLWARQSPSGQALGLLFGVKALPLPAGTSGISGTLQFLAAAGQSARPLPATCEGLFQKGGVDVEVQRGPRPVLDADPLTDTFNFGVAPTGAMTNVVFTGGAVSSGQCAYRLTGLSAWPNQILFPPPTVKGNGNDAASAVFWDVRAKSGVSPLVTCSAEVRNVPSNVRERPSNATDAVQSVKNSPFVSGFVGGANSGACAGNYDLVARSAVAMDAGKLAGRAKFVRPGDAVQDVSRYQNVETTGATRMNSARSPQSAVWSQPAAGVQTPHADQKPNWGSAPSPLGQQ
jgi:hypothetical protein